MTNTADEAQELISLIRTRGEEVEDAAGAITLIRLIPYAGGAIAGIISEKANQRRFEKVCDVLSDLNARLESRGSDPEQHLSKDQIIEVVHETLQTVATASDEKKIEALKNGLGYAFLSEDTFERKQLFLQVLRGCTSIELRILTALYEEADPYIVRNGSQQTASSLTDVGISGIPSEFGIQSEIPQGDWMAIGNKHACGADPLLKFLADKTGVDEGASEGAIRLLDGKGLTKAAPNLQRTDCKVLQWVEAKGGFSTRHVISATGVTPSVTIKPTPVEASKTEFGGQFLRFYR